MHLSVLYSQQKLGSSFYCSHFMDEKTKIRKSCVICPRAQGCGVAEPGAAPLPFSQPAQSPLFLDGLTETRGTCALGPPVLYVSMGSSVLGAIERDAAAQTPHKRDARTPPPQSAPLTSPPPALNCMAPTSRLILHSPLTPGVGRLLSGGFGWHLSPPSPGTVLHKDYPRAGITLQSPIRAGPSMG